MALDRSRPITVFKKGAGCTCEFRAEGELVKGGVWVANSDFRLLDNLVHIQAASIRPKLSRWRLMSETAIEQAQAVWAGTPYAAHT
jgi:hypothetical protein